jgi:hypothetical protein
MKPHHLFNGTGYKWAEFCGLSTLYSQQEATNKTLSLCFEKGFIIKGTKVTKNTLGFGGTPLGPYTHTEPQPQETCLPSPSTLLSADQRPMQNRACPAQKANMEAFLLPPHPEAQAGEDLDSKSALVLLQQHEQHVPKKNRSQDWMCYFLSQRTHRSSNLGSPGPFHQGAWAGSSLDISGNDLIKY